MQLWEKIVIGVAGVYIGYELITALNAKKLSFSLASINFNPSGLGGALAVTIAVTNPTTSVYVLQGIQAGVYTNGNFIGNITAPAGTSQTVAANQTTPVYLTMNVADVGVLATLAALFAGTAGSLSVTISGVAVLNNINFPLNITEKVF